LTGARTIIILYTLMGSVLALIGVLGSYLLSTGIVVVENAAMQLAALAASIAAFVIGLHWVIVGIASLRGAR